MRDLKRKRVDAPRIPTLEDVHPHTTWSMCVPEFITYSMWRDLLLAGRGLASCYWMRRARKWLIYDDQVERFEPLLVEGRVYYVQKMSAEPVMRNQDYRFADSHFVCCFTSQTVVREIRTVKDGLIPLFPPFMPLDRVWQFTMDKDMYVDVIGMVLYVSSVGFKDSLDNRRIPFRNICLMDGSFNIVKLVVWDKLLTGNLIAWEKSASQHAIVIATMLWANHLGHSLEATTFSRVYFDPDIAIAHELRQRINNDLTGLSSS